MSEPALSYSEADSALPTPAARTSARLALAKRLADIVCLPTTRITPQERHLTGDLLIELLVESDVTLRQRCARRVAALSEAPTMIVRFLARDSIEVARPLLTESDCMTDADLIVTARTAMTEHRELIAQRRAVSEMVSDALAEEREPSVIYALLRNNGAVISQTAIEQMVADSRDETAFCALLVKRPELRPSQGLAMFWWSDVDTRRRILQRFSVERAILQDAASDIFAMAAAEGWSDPLARKALQFIERRQRNRAAIERSPYESLEHAVEAALTEGMGRKLVEEISYLSGVKPATGAKIFTDLGGEPIAVLCKATGLKRDRLRALWTALRRPFVGDDGAPDVAWLRTEEAYDSLSADKAQTVLRYWNWALTSAMSPALAAAPAEAAQADEFSAAGRSARLVFGARG